MELEELRRLAAKEELSLNFIAKDEQLSKVLFDLQGNEDIILKGGTAINRVYLQNLRFSEDIDIDLVFSGTVKEAIPRTREIVKTVRGMNILKPRIMKDTIRYDLFYVNPLNYKDRVRLEFHLVKKAVHFSKKVVNFGFVPVQASLHQVYDLEELIKHKLTCLLQRKEGKDFFDLYYLLELPHQQLGVLAKEKELLLKAVQLDDREIKAIANVVNHYLPRKSRPLWGIFIKELEEKIRQLK